MLEGILKALPLDLAATISPVLFGIVVCLLSDQNKPKKRAFLVLLGATIVAIAVSIIGFVAGGTSLKKPSLSPVGGAINLALGALFVIYAFKKLIFPSKPRTQEKRKGQSVWVWFLAGLVLSVVNDSFFLIFAAAKEFGALNVNIWDKAIFTLVNIFFFTLPITLPILIELIFPRLAEKVLGSINRFLVNYGDLIIFVLFIIFGFYFIFKGLSVFTPEALAIR